jgi:hypothetical protein
VSRGITVTGTYAREFRAPGVGREACGHPVAVRRAPADDGAEEQPQPLHGDAVQSARRTERIIVIRAGARVRDARGHVEPSDFSFADGSGLSPDDLVTPRAIVKMLRWMNDPVRRGYWWATLAQPANEGTLRRRLVTLEHRLRGKTGTINGVNALSESSQCRTAATAISRWPRTTTSTRTRR